MATWSFDPTHSSIGFSVRHLMISKVRGHFNQWGGTFDYDEADPRRSKLSVRIEAASIDTRDEKRDAHLRSPDFFDAEKFPELTFESTDIERDGDDFVVAGNLTIHGITRAVQLKVESLGAAKDPWGGYRAGFSASTSVNRKEFGLTWNVALEAGGVVVGDKIEIAIEIEAVRAAAENVA
ncbi:MAG: YceI family protein [Myxococcales bacterium]|nr:YceI family protein [Myxococcales bacterium]